MQVSNEWSCELMWVEQSMGRFGIRRFDLLRRDDESGRNDTQ